MGTLYIVGTPIGNLEDISPRALEILGNADVILAEDTRVTAKLLSRYGLKKQVIRCDEEVSLRVLPVVIKNLESGKKIALVSDAGTPGVSDPGWRIVHGVRNSLPLVSIVPIPGTSAVTAALSVSGMNAGSFTFLGYPPHKKGRKTFFDDLFKISVRPVVFYESPHRMEKALHELEERNENISISVSREITKLYEETVAGTPREVREKFGKNVAKGEFVVVVS